MSAITNAFNTPEVANILFSNLSVKFNLETTMLVCKTWRENVIYPIQKQLVSKAEKELEAKMLSFLTITGNGVRAYCSTFQETEKMLSDLTLKQTFEKLNNLNNLTEKYTVCLSLKDRDRGWAVCDVFTITATAYEKFQTKVEEQQQSTDKIEAAKKRKEAICGKTFILFHCEGKSWNEDNSDSVNISYFPIELFNLKVRDESKLTGCVNKASYCFPLKGRLIEFLVELPLPGEKDDVHLIPSWLQDSRNYYVPSFDAK